METGKPYEKEMMVLLKDTFDIEKFRYPQREAIISVMEGKSYIVLAPTGDRR